MRSGRALHCAYLSASVTDEPLLSAAEQEVLFGAVVCGLLQLSTVHLRGTPCTTTHTTQPVKHWRRCAAVTDILYLAWHQDEKSSRYSERATATAWRARPDFRGT